jgi:hypothetical protein
MAHDDDALGELLALSERLAAGFADRPDVAAGLRQAGAVAASDPEMALTRSRKLLEAVVREVFERSTGEPAGTRPLENLIQRLVKDQHLPPRVAGYANFVRELGNVGTHAADSGVTAVDVRNALSQLARVLEWHFGGAGGPAAAPAPGTERPLTPPQAAPPRRRLRWAVTGLGLVTAAAAAVIVHGAWQQRAGAGVEQFRGTPAAEVLDVLRRAPAGSAPGRPLELEVGLFGGPPPGPWVTLADGHRLADGDRYGLVLCPKSDGHLYVMQIDTTGSVYWLFPRNPQSGDELSYGANPVRPGATIDLPPRGDMYWLNAARGVEHVYVAFAPGAWAELEAALGRTARSGEGDVRPEVARAAIRLRGPGGVVRPGAEVDVQRTGGGVRVQTANHSAGGPALVVERWFRHAAPR